MTEKSLFEECQTSIEKGHEIWRSYFLKWETIAKYEEEMPESELFNEPEVKSTKKPQRTKILMNKKNKNHKKIIKKRIPAKCTNEVETIKQVKDVDDEDVNNKQLEMVLKTVLSDILNANRNKFEVFAVLSQTVSQEDSLSYHQTSVCNDFQPNRHLVSSISRSVCPARNTVLESLSGGSFGFHPGNNRTRILNGGYPKLNFLNNFTQQKLLLSVGGIQVAQQSTMVNFGIRSFSSCENMELKPLEWDFSHKSPNRVCRKINKEYFIKRSFPEMNITQDGKRFRSLCLRKRTNSVSLSMENSNFITPERKPSERKCFSENVLQRKRRRPSKVFFDNEVEDSESDDQTETHAPLIHCKNKKFKPRLISEAFESDSDDCETIFDRVTTG